MSIDVTMDVLDECVVMAEETLDVAAPESLVSCLKALTPLLTKVIPQYLLFLVFIHSFRPFL